MRDKQIAKNVKRLQDRWDNPRVRLLRMLKGEVDRLVDGHYPPSGPVAPILSILQRYFEMELKDK